MQAFSRLNVGAAKGDFIRYLSLWVYGGIYLDLDSEITISLDSFIRPHDSFIFFIDREYNIQQFCFMAESRLPILKDIINEMVSRIHNRVDNIFAATGPALVTDVFYQHLSNSFVLGGSLRNTTKSQRQAVFKRRYFQHGRLVYRSFGWRNKFKIRMTNYNTTQLYDAGKPRYIPTFNEPTPHLYKE